MIAAFSQLACNGQRIIWTFICCFTAVSIEFSETSHVFCFGWFKKSYVICLKPLRYRKQSCAKFRYINADLNGFQKINVDLLVLGEPYVCPLCHCNSFAHFLCLAQWAHCPPKDSESSILCFDQWKLLRNNFIVFYWASWQKKDHNKVFCSIQASYDKI